MTQVELSSIVQVPVFSDLVCETKAHPQELFFMVMIGNLQLVEANILGDSLRGRKPADLTFAQLKHWLACHGASRNELKAALMKR